MDDNELLNQLVSAVMANPKYRPIDPGLIRTIGQDELAHRRNFKAAIKATRNKLHQVGGAYQESLIDYPRLSSELDELPNHVDNQALCDYCRRVMAQHASTHERLPILERFYTETLASLAPIQSVLDLACGMNPLALPWMPLAPGAAYYAIDIYQDMVGLVNQFLAHIRQPGTAQVANLIAAVPSQSVQVALLLKTLPCLEQLDKTITTRLLDSIHAQHLLISYPAHSLGGQSKGMVANYESHFHQLAEGRNWSVKRFEFPSELAFLVSRPAPGTYER
jgi:16S rRNA (guanine(1405)-N(7))-methyltransferase